MIDVFKSLSFTVSDPGWRPSLAAVAGLASAALAPLFVISSRMLTEPSDRTHHLFSAALVQTRAATRHVPSPAPRPPGAHWGQIAQGTEDRIRSARKAVEQQSAALIQIDAADFTLAKIVEDLAAVMPRASELRTQAPRAVPLPQRALAA